MKTSSAEALGWEMDRLYPSQVDEAPRDFGWGREAGHIGYPATAEYLPTVAWYCAAGEAGDPIFRVHPDDLDELLARLAAMPDGAGDADYPMIRTMPAFAGLRITWCV